jgi:HD superfamily phosphohydrolase
MQYLDPLYGQLEVSGLTWNLFQTEALTRIRDISLSAVPPMATPSGMIGSRFEHSVGVWYLASQLALKDGFAEMGNNLLAAALFHDVGSPPFSHITETFLEDILKRNHEEFAGEIIYSQESKKTLQEYGADPSTVYGLITGTLKPWSDLINGTIDLDNIDNSLRWGMAIGIFNHKFYEPEEVAEAFVWQDRKLALSLNHYPNIQKWELCRRLVYDVVYSDMNLIPETMLFRGLQFAYENNELSDSFFRLTDSSALYLLENKFNPQTQRLISDMKHWFHYVPAIKVTKSGDVSEGFKTFCSDWKERQKIADIVSDGLGIERESVTVYAGKDRGFKKIHLPFVGEKEAVEHQPLQKLNWRINVYLHPKYEDKKGEVSELVTNILEEHL